MIKTLIFSGGTGSIALQTGLYKLYGEAVKTDIIISAYDNGKSTGECRKVFNGKILGPSDLRKNQLTQFKLLNGLGESSAVPNDRIFLYELFNRRISDSSWKEAYSHINREIKATFEKIEHHGASSAMDDKRDLLLHLTDYFFYTTDSFGEKKVRETIKDISFSDFSISNLFYATAAAANGNSLGFAGSLMAELLEIPDNVHLISDRNLYLHAETLSGTIISDEGCIVAWNHPEDPIADVFLLDEQGKETIPYVDEENRTDISCKDLIEEADIILFSSGTQWSSLIPTYMHAGLKEMLEKSRAKKYLIMNNIQDCDMKGISAIGLLGTVSRYINLSNVKIVLNSNAEETMSHLSSDSPYRTLTDKLSEKGSSKHCPQKLANIIFQDFFSEYLRAKWHFFDFDDTIWSSSNEEPDRRYSKLNLKLLYKGFIGNSIIISGNSANHFHLLRKEFQEAEQAAGVTAKGLDIYCNGGKCHYIMRDGIFVFKRHLCSDYNLDEDYYLLSEKILETLNENGWNLSIKNFENRENCILSIKPLTGRKQAKQLIDEIILQLFKEAKYVAHINGNTTIDIMNAQYDKKMAVKVVQKELGLPMTDIMYIGDKTEQGNDSCLVKTGLKVLGVKDVFDFYCFAITYINNRMQ